MSCIVAKFGGSSLADAAQFEKVRSILSSDPDRRIVVPSAPGKRFAQDEKVTDLLYRSHKLAASGADISPAFDRIEQRYREIHDALGLSLPLADILGEIRREIPLRDADYAASRGEYLNGRLLSAFLGWEFIDAADVIFFKETGAFDARRTQVILSAKLENVERCVIPGFYGSKPDGAIHTFSRGGSDVTGAIVARGAKADLYENWTDVSGFLMADPRVVTNPKPISMITYRELRELSYMGATVLHDEAIFPVRQVGIPIQIRNTNHPEDPGTLIVKDADEGKPTGAITGIAGKKGIVAIAIEKAMMNSELGFGRRVLGAFEDMGISFEHLPTGIDTMTVVCSENQIPDMDALLRAIDRAVEPDTMHVERGLALIATVGRGMARYPGTAGRLFRALADAGVNVRMIDQGSSEINIIVGIDERDFEAGMRAIYSKFIG